MPITVLSVVVVEVVVVGALAAADKDDANDDRCHAEGVEAHDGSGDGGGSVLVFWCHAVVGSLIMSTLLLEVQQRNQIR